MKPCTQSSSTLTEVGRERVERPVSSGIGERTRASWFSCWSNVEVVLLVMEEAAVVVAIGVVVDEEEKEEVEVEVEGEEEEEVVAMLGR